MAGLFGFKKKIQKGHPSSFLSPLIDSQVKSESTSAGEMEL